MKSINILLLTLAGLLLPLHSVRAKGIGDSPKKSKPGYAAPAPSAKPKPTPKPMPAAAPKKLAKPGAGSAGSLPAMTPPRPSASKPSKPTSSGARLPQGKPAGLPAKPMPMPSRKPAPPTQKPAPPPQIKPKPTKPAHPPSTITSLPSYMGSGSQRPDRKPGTKPTVKPAIPLPPPVVKPAIPTTKPVKPGGKPTVKPAIPVTPEVVKPALPTTKPGKPGGKPSTLPGDFIGMKPILPGDGHGPQPLPQPKPKPTKPGNWIGSKPDFGGKPGKPTTLPADLGQRPGVGSGGGFYPPPTQRPTTLPAVIDYRPAHPPRPPRPPRPDHWQNVQVVNQNQWNQWHQTQVVNINHFQVNRVNHWTHIDNRYRQPDWVKRYNTQDYRDWRRDVWDYRRDRCHEIWYHRERHWDDLFDDHWWNSCWWVRRPEVHYHVNVSPWWSWRPLVWASVGAFFGSQFASQHAVYDPGTTVIYEGDTYYINGQPAGDAVAAREQAAALATPEVEEIPVPEPAPEGEPETWLPLGVWALTQQEQGDATMFMQLSVDRDGLVAGAYKNVMTGDEQPILGQLDRETQRIAWHVGEVTQTVYETGFANFEGDVLSVFVHFGESSTQTWLLVRLPSPELPPGVVRLPEASQ